MSDRSDQEDSPRRVDGSPEGRAPKRRHISHSERTQGSSDLEDEDYRRLEDELRGELASDHVANDEDAVRSSTAGPADADTSLDVIEIGPASDADPDSDSDARLQQVVEISDDEAPRSPRPEHKRALDYRCPICFDPPEAALVTPCGHVFCTECLFQMVNSSRGQRSAGHCALCRRDVRFKDVRLIIMRKKRIRKT
ncbi:RING-type domain-containing protein [Lachancea thermotolerans]|uniref:KLTH0C06094p n=1 Tax=Lachancea thermotolerans (strain ATCC 56472 / CBS 6340 / NRRL Y-8284) TaxID=559295 RepID=C5DE41_LACTC|nr:KLTH0C06094p [Lachancea thermotolerans CBS 6340]CAR22052.1 KLTH0C06094p [Lachancea thermotolerans CBS 6340]